MWFSESIIITGIARLHLSFNPCSSGCGSLRNIISTYRWEYDSFNPCSSGCGSLSSKRIFIIIILLKFQSLFFWMWFSEQVKIALQFVDLKFQSLFFWMWFSENISQTKSAPGKHGFNPCSSGCGSLRKKEKLG